MKRIISIAAILILLTGIIPMASINAASPTMVRCSIQHVPWPEYPQSALKTAKAHFSEPDTKIYLVSGTFNGYAYSDMNIGVQPSGQLNGEGLFSFVEMFDGKATGNSFLGRCIVKGQIFVSEASSEGNMTGTITIIAGTGNLADLSGSLNVELALRYNSYFYQILWSGVLSGKLNYLP